MGGIQKIALRKNSGKNARNILYYLLEKKEKSWPLGQRRHTP
jgi:hypothetical protein